MLLSLGFFLFRAWYATRIDLAPDEAYYWQWSQHPALSYYDQGPGLAVAIGASTRLLGHSELGVRLPALLSGLALSLLALWFARQLGGARRRDLGGSWELAAVGFRPAGDPHAWQELGLWVVLAMNSMLLFAAGGVLMVHDPLQVTFWALGLAAAFAVARTGAPWAWLLMALAGGLGVLCKYTGAFLLPGLLLALLTHKELRPRLRGPWPWIALAVGAAACSPILVWNLREGWPSFRHVFAIGGGDPSRRSWAALPEFLGSQLGLATPVFFGLVVLAWWDGLRRQLKGGLDPLRWILWCCSAPVFGFFLLLSLRSRVEGNWPAPAYWGGVLLAGAWLAGQGRLWGRATRWAAGLALAMTALAYTQAAWPFLPIPPERAKWDSASRVDGWRELGRDVEAARLKLPEQSFVACSTYQNAASLCFYLPGHPLPVILIGGEINHQYRFWNRPQDWVGRDAVVVVGQDWELHDMAPRFTRLEPLPDSTFSRNGVEVRRLKLYLARSFKG